MTRQPGDAGSPDPPAHYEIRGCGVLDSHRSAWFGGLQISNEPGQTMIAGQATDQAALHGLFTKIRDLGLPLIAVRQIDPDQSF